MAAQGWAGRHGWENLLINDLLIKCKNKQKQGKKVIKMELFYIILYNLFYFFWHLETSIFFI